MKKSNTTIHDISKSLGIDSSTVSRALNDSPRVSEKTKVKILARAEELGYQRNSLASQLRTNRSNTIGVIVPRISRHFFSTVIAGIEETAFEAGYGVVICQSLEQIEREEKLIDTLLSNRVDGLLISISMQTNRLDHFESYKKHGFPLIFFDRPCNKNEYTNVIIDDFKAGFEATEHLIKQGCKNIFHMAGPQNMELYIQRTKGYKAALVKYGVEVREEFIFESKLMNSDGVEAARKILKLKKADAVFSSNDTAAIGAMQHLKASGIKIPEDVAFVGFSNEPVSTVIEPSLSTISQSDFEMGQIATKLLISQIENKSDLKLVGTKILQPKLIIRDSSRKAVLK
jgi:LacI family transcriptional regulator